MTGILNALTIAGSDSSGGAGIQADLKTFSALGVYGASVLTALTAQNTHGVTAVHPVPPGFVAAQLEAVFGDLRIDAVKCGMLANAAIIRTVADVVGRFKPAVFVVDPVMIAKGGHALLDPEAVNVLRDVLLPRATMVTPNLPEAAALLDEPCATTEAEMVAQGRRLRARLAPEAAVLMKGGHLPSDESPDWLLARDGEWRFPQVRVATQNTHGTGCTLSAALTALAARHHAGSVGPTGSDRPDWHQTVGDAKAWLTLALRAADQLSVGKGPGSIGPVHHFHALWKHIPDEHA